MSREPTDSELSRLLSGRTGPSVLQQEAAFEAVMKQVAPKRRPRWLGLMVPLSAVAALALGVFVMRPPPADPEFAVRGGGQAGLVLRCIQDQRPAPCALGATLAFEVRPSDKPYFAAFSRREDGTIIWYLPAPEAASAKQDGLLSQGFELHAPHQAGRLEVFGLFSDQPMTRDDLKAALGDGLEPSAHLDIVRRTLEVEPEVRP